MRIDFIKCHGSGNDFPMIDARAISLADAAWAGIARALADRRGPVGGDGLLLMTERDGFRMFNPDGSEAETCLNGIRCVARMGFEAQGTNRAVLRLCSSQALVERDAELAPGVTTIRETAGPADLDVTRWPLAGATRIVDALVPQLSATRRFTAVAMPNPHLVSFVETVDERELAALGTACEAAPAWLPNRANMSFVERRGEAALFVRTFERGVGLTDSCGSAMAASAYAACLTGRAAFARELTVFNRGGRVLAQAEADGMVRLSGNATYEWAGTIELDPPAGGGRDWTAHDLLVTRRFAAEAAAWAAVVAAA